MDKEKENTFDPYAGKLVKRATKQEQSPDSSLDKAIKYSTDFGEGFIEGAIPFKPQTFAAGEAILSGPSSLEELYSKYREAEKINQQRYEELMKDNDVARVGEMAGMLFDPVVSGVSKGLVSFGGRILKPLVGLSKEEKAIETALKAGDAKGIASALEVLNLKKSSPTLAKTLATEIPTAALMGGAYGASRSKGTLGGEGEAGLSQDVIEGALTGGATGLALGSLGHGFSKLFGKASKKADIARAIAGKELESGDRLGVPIDLEEGALSGKTFAPPEGPQLIYEDTSKRAKELTDRAVQALQKRKDELNQIFEEKGGDTVNSAASIADTTLEKLITNAQGRAIEAAEKRAEAAGTSLSNKEIVSIHDQAARKVVMPFLKQNYPELHYIAKGVGENRELYQLFKSTDKNFIKDLLTGNPISFSQLYNIQRRIKINANKLADDFKLSEIDRDILFGRGDFFGKGILYNETSSGEKTSGLLEQVLEKTVPDIEKYRRAIRDIGAGPVEAILNKNPEIAAQPLKAWNFKDAKIQNILEREFSKLIEQAGGTNVAAGYAAEDLNQIYNLLLKAEAEGASSAQIKNIAEDILDLKNRVSKSSRNMAALVGVAGQNQAMGHMSMDEISKAYKPLKMLEGLTSLSIGRAVGKTEKQLKSLGGPPVKLRDIGINKLKQYAEFLSKDDNAVISNIGKSAMQGLEENPMYKAVFLNQVAQSSELRSGIKYFIPGLQEKEEFNPYGGKRIKK
jgi:hypothetical protein